MFFKRNYYKILRIPRDADLTTIKSSYRKQSKIYHPDQGGDPEKMKIINEAYEVLSNTELRLKYDQWLKEIERQKNISNTNDSENSNFNTEKKTSGNSKQGNSKSASKENDYEEKAKKESPSSTSENEPEKESNQGKDTIKELLRIPNFSFTNRGLWISMVLIVYTAFMMNTFPDHGIFALIGWVGFIWLCISVRSFIYGVLILITLCYTMRLVGILLKFLHII